VVANAGVSANGMWCMRGKSSRRIFSCILDASRLESSSLRRDDDCVQRWLMVQSIQSLRFSTACPKRATGAPKRELRCA
jgi:hypothetical protein